MKKILASTLCLISLSSFATSATPTTISIKQLQTTFNITLPTNPTTGFKWYLGKYSPELTPLRAQYTPAQTKLIGAPGSTVWTFKLEKNALNVPRVLKVQLIYMRAWDATSASKKTFWVVTGS